MIYLSVIVSFCNHQPNKLRLVALKCFLLEGDDDGNVTDIIHVSHESQTQPAPLGAPWWHSPWSSRGSALQEREVTLRIFSVNGVHWAAPGKQQEQAKRGSVPAAACQCQWHTPLAWPIPAAAPTAPASPRAAPSPTPTARAAPATASVTRSPAVPHQRYGRSQLSPERSKVPLPGTGMLEFRAVRCCWLLFPLPFHKYDPRIHSRF